MPDPQLVVLVNDLILSSRIAAAARETGVAITIVRRPQSLEGVDGQRLIVDLNLAGAIEAASCWRAAGSPRTVVGFVAHVDADTARRARELGIDRVLARSRFVETLGDLLTATP